MDTDNIIDIIKRIKEIGYEGRDLKNLIYRTAKLSEEAGECNGAMISVDKKSYKNLTYMDVLEEALDTFIVAVDIALSDFPEFTNKTEEEKNDVIFGILNKKLDKWENVIGQKG